MNADNVNTTSTSDHREEELPTSWWDRAVLIYVVAVTITLLSIFTVLRIKRLWPPLLARSPGAVSLMILAGLVQTWAALITNDHFSWSSEIEHEACAFVGFWAQYMFGLAIWITVMTDRLITYGAVFSVVLTGHGFSNTRKYKWMVSISILFPLFVVLLWMSLVGGSSFDERDHRCESDLFFKVCVLGWVVFWTITLAIVTGVSTKYASRDYEEQFKPTWQIIAFGVCVMTTNAIILIPGWLVYPFARFMATSSVASLHLFTAVRLVGKRCYRAYFGSTTYLSMWSFEVNEYEVPLDEVPTGSDILFPAFLKYCETQPLLRLNKEKGDGELVDPGHLAKCYTAIDDFVKHVSSLTTTDATNEALEISNRYLMKPRTSEEEEEEDYGKEDDSFLVRGVVREDEPPLGKYCIHIHPDIKSGVVVELTRSPSSVEGRKKSIDWMRLFDPIREWIVEVLNDKFGGAYTRNEVPKKGDTIREENETLARQKAKDRMNKSNLLTDP